MEARPVGWRVVLVFAVLVVCFGGLVSRLFQKQVLEHDQYSAIAANQSISARVELADRGEILATDKEGKTYPLAASVWTYYVSVSPRAVANKEKLAELLANDIPQLTKDSIFNQINNDKVYVPPIISGLDEATANKIRDKNYRGVYVGTELSRQYPEADGIAPQVVGFVGADGQGKYGIEAYYDGLLRGKTGQALARQDSLGRLLYILGETRPVNGQQVVLSLDYNLQYFVESKLQAALETYRADEGEIIILNPKNGEILALAGLPKYDPNKYNEVPAGGQGVFLASASSEAYEAGSVLKPIIMSAALNEGVVTPETSNVFSGTTKILDRQIHNVDDRAYGRETMGQVLENSDNVAMTWVASLLGAQKEREYLAKYGFGEKTGIDLVGESPGSLQAQSEWNEVLRSTAAFGQGITVTLVQLASAYAAIANGGQLITPHLARSVVSSSGTERLEWPTRRSVIKPEIAAQVREMLGGVVERGHGKKAKIEGVKVGGKTGTAQVPSPNGGYYADRHIGSFAGMFPLDDPQFVMVVRLDNPKTVQYAESSAAPVFGEIAKWMADYYGLR